MEKAERKWPLTFVNVLVALAILMILSALIVPIFVPPDGKTASARPDSNRPITSVQP